MEWMAEVRRKEEEQEQEQQRKRAQLEQEHEGIQVQLAHAFFTHTGRAIPQEEGRWT